MRRVVGLVRVSGKGQEKGHGYERQEDTIMDYCKKNELVLEKFFKEQITGTSEVIERSSVQGLLDFCSEEEIDTILVENAGRFARDKDEAILGMFALRSQGIKSLVFCDREIDFFNDWKEDPIKAIIPFLELAFAEKDKNDLVEKLRCARDDKRLKNGKCEGRKKYGEVGNPDELALIGRVKVLRRKPRKGKRRSYAEIAVILASEGFLSRKGTKLLPMQIQRLAVY